MARAQGKARHLKAPVKTADNPYNLWVQLHQHELIHASLLTRTHANCSCECQNTLPQIIIIVKDPQVHACDCSSVKSKLIKYF